MVWHFVWPAHRTKINGIVSANQFFPVVWQHLHDFFADAIASDHRNLLTPIPASLHTGTNLRQRFLQVINHRPDRHDGG